MNAQKGYYSLIQFCPDASRLEAVNLGVILFCPETGYLDAKTSSNSRRAEMLVGRGNLARESLRQARTAIEQRLKVDRESFRDIDSLNKFIATRGNALQLTAARPIKVFDPDRDLDQLFQELVGGKSAAAKSSKTLFPELNSLFARLSNQGRAQLNFHAQLPVLEQEFSVPFAYRNGVLNLVQPQYFRGRATQKALDLAIRGNLIHKHGVNGEKNPRLVVVSRFEDSSAELVSHVDELFLEYQVTHVKEEQLGSFASLIETEAHG